VSGLFRFSNSATDHLLKKGPEKMPVPVRDTMTDRVRMAWIRTLRREKLISIWPKTNKTVLLQSNRTVSSASKVQDPGASHDPDVYSFILARPGEFFVVPAPRLGYTVSLRSIGGPWSTTAESAAQKPRSSTRRCARDVSRRACSHGGHRYPLPGPGARRVPSWNTRGGGGGHRLSGLRRGECQRGGSGARSSEGEKT